MIDRLLDSGKFREESSLRGEERKVAARPGEVSVQPAATRGGIRDIQQFLHVSTPCFSARCSASRTFRIPPKGALPVSTII